MNRWPTIYTAVLAILATSWTAAASESPTAKANEILLKAECKGGLVAHVGCGDGKLTAALRRGDAFIVHGLDSDPASAREFVKSSGLYGTVSVEAWKTPTLPYSDNIVNLLVLSTPGLGESVAGSEALRVLVPGGAAVWVDRSSGEIRKVLRKPWPKEISGWSHYLYNAANQNVSSDSVVAPPRSYRWQAGPLWTRNHDIASSFQNMVSDNGRLFCIMDLGSTATLAAPANWTLLCRDAFNGKWLWERPLAEWLDYMFGYKMGPLVIMRRMVASGDKLYVTMGIQSVISELDAATGKTLREFPDTQNAQEIIVRGNRLYTVTGATSKSDRKTFTDADLSRRSIKAIDLNSGQTLWSVNTMISPMTLCADQDKLCLYDGEKVMALHAESGKQFWLSEPLLVKKKIHPNFAPTLTLYKEMAFFSHGPDGDISTDYVGNGRMSALDGSTGKVIWSTGHAASNYKSMFTLMPHSDRVWFQSSGPTRSHGDGRLVGLNYRTGQVEVAGAVNTDPHEVMHPRCHQAKATINFMITGWMGTEFIEWNTNKYRWNQWARGACTYGSMPANGMLYVPPNPCQCFLGAQIHGLNALSPTSPVVPPPSPESRLEKGAAYANPRPKLTTSAPGETWPTYRGDYFRSGHNPASIGDTFSLKWRKHLGGMLTQAICDGQNLYIASKSDNALFCLSMNDGSIVWTFVAGGPIDSPPSIHNGDIFFGGRDGFIYSVDANTGQMRWRFQAGPIDRRILAFDRIESLWPVNGSVLIHDGKLHAVAGHQRWLDGGLRYLILNTATGALVSETIHDGTNPTTGKDYQETVVKRMLPFSLADILSTDEKNIFMGTETYDLQGNVAAEQIRLHRPGDSEGLRLIAQNGMLDDAWYFRSYWSYASAANNSPNRGGTDVWKKDPKLAKAKSNFIGEIAPSGRILSFDKDSVYGYGRRPGFFNYGIGNMLVVDYRLFKSSKHPESQIVSSNNKVDVFKVHDVAWSDHNHPIFAYAFLLCGDKVLTAGPVDPLDLGETPSAQYRPSAEDNKKMAAALEGKLGVKLVINRAEDGKQTQAIDLDAIPVFDGLSAANNHLFLVDDNGGLTCLYGGNRR